MISTFRLEGGREQQLWLHRLFLSFGCVTLEEKQIRWTNMTFYQFCSSNAGIKYSGDLLHWMRAPEHREAVDFYFKQFSSSDCGQGDWNWQPSRVIIDTGGTFWAWICWFFPSLQILLPASRDLPKKWDIMSPAPQGVSNRRQFSNHIWNVWGYSCLRLPGKPSFLLTSHLWKDTRLHTLTAEPSLCAPRGLTAGVYVGLFMCPCGCDCVAFWKGTSFCILMKYLSHL